MLFDGITSYPEAFEGISCKFRRPRPQKPPARPGKPSRPIDTPKTPMVKYARILVQGCGAHFRREPIYKDIDMDIKSIRKASILSSMAFCAFAAGFAFAGEEDGSRTSGGVSVLATETRTATTNGISWTYMVQDGCAILGGGRRTVRAIDPETEGNIEIPAILDGYSVTAIGNYAFYDCGGITGVSLPSTITSIGKDAFNGATSLASISLPEGIVSLGSGAFEECWNLVSVDLPSSLTELPETAFAYCLSLESLIIPETTASIGADAFYGCDALKRVIFLGAPPKMEDSGIFDLDAPPALLCRMAHYAAFLALASDGQDVFTIDGSGLIPEITSFPFGPVGLDTRDAETVVFKNTSTGAVTVTGIEHLTFASTPAETFDDSSAVDGWAFSPEWAWGIENGVLSSSLDGTAIDGRRYAYLPGTYSNFTVQADIRLYGDQDCAVGILACADERFDGGSVGSGLRFQIAPGGEYMILRYEDGERTTIVEWTECDAIVTDGVNTLTVAAHGSNFAFAINGEQVWAGEDSALPGPGRVGFFNYDDDIGNYMTIDNLRFKEEVFAVGDEAEAIAAFPVAAQFPFTLASGESANFPISFQPLKKGFVGTMFHISSSKGDSGEFAVSGTGVEDDLWVVGARKLAFSGHTGGPFSPESLTLSVSNSFRRAQSFTIAVPEWLECTEQSVGIPAVSSTNIVFRLKSSAAALATGKYEGAVEIVHTDNGYAHSLPATLDSYVTGTPILPDGELVVTNRPGLVQTRTVPLGNAATSDGALSARLTTMETGLVEATAESTAAAKAARRAAGGVRIKSGAKHSPRRILVRFDTARLSSSCDKAGKGKPDYAAAVERLCGGRILKTYHIVPGLVLVELPEATKDSAALESTLRDIEAHDNVVYAEPDYLVKANLVPNDPDYEKLWGMSNTGQSSGKPGADISAEEAWDTTTGSRDIIVGVIDSGIDYTHPDLAANMWRNPGEIPDNGIDDDGNGYVDDVYGINAIKLDGDPYDDNEHGTHCAGTIGGVGNNGIGVAGVCWNVSLMALKFLDSEGYGYDADAVTCIEYAIDNGARVLSNSWGGEGSDKALEDAIKAAEEAGIVFVAAAGNETSDNDKTPSYPASYDCASLISVVSTDKSDKLSYFSNWGETSCDIAAPGSGIWSCAPGGDYQSMSGTSMATPHVSGAAALLLSVNPDLTPAQVKAALLSTVDKLDSLKGKCVTEGRMNVAAAIKSLPLWSSVSPKTVDGILPGESTPISVTFDAAGLAPGEYTATLTAKALDQEAASDSMALRMVIVPDSLSLLDAEELESTQNEGETSGDGLELSFENTGSSPLEWSLTSSAAWLVPEQSSGTLAAGESFTLDIAVSGSEMLAAGRHTATLTLENTTTGARFFTTVVLTVTPGSGPLYVDAVNGDDAYNGRSETYPMRTLQAAAAKATDGTEIFLADGVYGPVRCVKSVSFSIRGVNGCEKVFIDGGGTNRCCTFFSDEVWNSYSSPQGTNVTVTGVTLINGFASGDGNGACGGGAFGGRYEKCRIMNCRAGSYGGGACYAVLDRCEVRGNMARSGYGGGLYYCHATDSLIAGNEAESPAGSCYGGGVYYGMLNGCTVAGNTIPGWGYGPGVYYAAATNTIVWANSVSGYSDITQERLDSNQTNAVFMADPGFRAPEDGLWTLSAGSPAIDAGCDDAVVNDTDLAGNDRILGDSVDAGCYEGVDDRPYLAGSVRGTGLVSAPYAYADEDGYASLTAIETSRPFLRWEDEEGNEIGTECILTVSMGEDTVRRAVAVFTEVEFYVDAATGDDANEGTDPEEPLLSIMAAVAKAVPGDTIHVASGVYAPINTAGKAVTIIGAGIGESIIDGGNTDRCAMLGYNCGEGTILVGFTLRNGYAHEDEYLDDGGGAYGGTLIACELTANYAEDGGGASQSRLESCLVSCNVAMYVGSGIDACETYNCSVVGNRSESYGSDAAGAFGGEHYNCAFAGNVDAGGLEVNWVEVDEADNCLEGAKFCGMVDPFHGDARPRPGSPLVDAGDDDNVTTEFDITGEVRIQGDCVDIGCYEGVRYTGLVALVTVQGHGFVEPESVLYESGATFSFTAIEDGRRFLRWEDDDGNTLGTDMTLTVSNATEDVGVTAVFESLAFYADASAPAGGNGLSPETAVRSLQDAIDLAYGMETVYAAPGVYTPIEVKGKRIDIIATGGRDETIIDGGGKERCAYLGEAPSSGTTVSGFTLRNGFDKYDGGGAYGGRLSNCVVTLCMVSNSWSSCSGGATYCSDLYDCVLTGNTNCGYEAYGGASSYGTAYRTVFSNNTARAVRRAYGGAASVMATYDCLFVGNMAIGGIPDEGGISYSESGYGGAAAWGSHYNATMTRNSAEGSEDGNGGGAYDADLYNSIVYGNNADKEAELYSCAGGDICTDDPGFVDADTGDFRLVADSPCIDAGDNGYVFTKTDLAGNRRIQDGTVDLGCYELYIPDLEITTESLPAATAGAAYSVQLAATGGAGEPYTWSSAAGYSSSRAANSFSATGTAQGWQEDDGCWELELPFDFPVYGNTYGVAFIGSNGTISFGETCDYCDYDYDAFATLPMIAALWYDLTTEDGDIHIQTSATNVTIRWSCSYLDGGLPVNVSATLHADGRIVLSYGDGNKHGGFVGVSAGDGMNFTVIDDSYESLNAQDFVLAPIAAKPDWLELSEDGNLSGTPHAAGSHIFCVTVADSAGRTASKMFTLDVAGDGESTTTTPVPVAYSWLESYPEVLETFDGDYEAMANSQSPGETGDGKTWPDGTPCYVWQDFVAGTSPVDDSVFTAKIRMEGTTPVIEWEPDTPELRASRTYRTLGKKTLLDGRWLEITDEDPSAYNFFKVTVEMP